MRMFGFLGARFRGFRVVNLLGLTLMLVIAVGSYALKTMAGVQDAGAAGLDEQIAQEQKRIRMLNLEIASLGAAPRVEALSRQYLSLAPEDPKHDIALEALPAAVGQARPPAPPATASVDSVSAAPAASPDPAVRQ